ncbi:MAG: CotH kinase family protein [Lachnospiraceae bacterium]|nr:CotH kinase family protein [Lachnospiraceae bacterium]
MKKNRLKKICVGILVTVLLSGTIAVEASEWRSGGFGRNGRGNGNGISHGTSTEKVSEDMLNNTPPADYTVNPSTQADAMLGEYNKYFLEDSIQTVSIEIDENNLNYLLQNATAAPSVMTTSVTIGDVTLGYCGLKTKGNYTLEHSYTDNYGSDRFSFTINFGKYVKKADYGQTQNFFGANKISFNNFFFDKSMMKEFFSLKLMDEMGLPTPQYGLAKLYINGEYYGVYAMIEAFDESILEQYYQVDDDDLSSYLCKPSGTNLIYEELLEDDAPLWAYDEETYADVEDMLPTVMDWVRKLNCLSAGTDFEGNEIDVNSESYLELLNQIMDVDSAVRYFATHSWLCQMDDMFVNKQNYGLYIDEDGKCLLMPWDYDLSFGCYFPSNAESTANYDIEVMYSRNVRPGADGTANKEFSTKTYAKYPIFNVIYQNDALMEQYRGYMKECSKIAALGGTIEHTGKSYNPGYFNSYIETMEEEIYEAAAEDLAENVYYMNWTNQPNDVKSALPNLSRIIAMRSVGVYEQVERTGATVCGEGCDLSTLGNAGRGKNSTSGLLSVVDSATGIFVTAEYAEAAKGSRANSPMLVLDELEAEDGYYQDIQAQLGATEEDSLVVYGMNTWVKPESDYTLHIPLAQAYMEAEGEIKFFSYDSNSKTLTEISMTTEDNLYTGVADSIKYIVIYQEGGHNVDIEYSAEMIKIIVVAVVIFILAMQVLLAKYFMQRRKY